MQDVEDGSVGVRMKESVEPKTSNVRGQVWVTGENIARLEQGLERLLAGILAAMALDEFIDVVASCKGPWLASVTGIGCQADREAMATTYSVDPEVLPSARRRATS